VPENLRGQFTAVLDFKTDPFKIINQETKFTIP